MNKHDLEVQELLKLPPGVRANRVLHDILLRPRFLGYWTFLEPMHQGTEISDVVLVWEDTAILFEAKTRGVPKPADIGWLREKLGEAVDQLNARSELLNSGTVTLRNEWRGELCFDPSKINCLYGIVVLTADFEPFEWRELSDEECQRAKLPIQVFSLFDLDYLLKIFNTPGDLIAYYDMRARFGRERRMLVGREVETFTQLVGEWHLYWPDDPEQGSRFQHFLVDRGNAVLRTPLATDESYRLWAASLLVDMALRPAERKAEVDRQGRPIGSRKHSNFLNAVESLAELTRERRSFYGGLWHEAASEALAQGGTATTKARSEMRARSYVLVATPLGVEPSEETLRRLAGDTMVEHGTKSCLVLGASAASIKVSFETLLKWCRSETADVPPEELILKPTIVWAERQ